jgi:uncharacterized repeat protein (TIGR03806 family)
MKAKYIFTWVLTVVLLLGFYPRPEPEFVPKFTLSKYGFFKGNIADQIPADGVIPYTLNTPLFSDYADKLRFIKLPEGATIPYNDTEVFDFPVGTTIIKTFYYTLDERKPEKGRRLMETRLLIHEKSGWKAIPYHWNEDQGEAALAVGGSKADVTFVNAKGKKKKFEYSFPNVNQCKGCHSWDGKMRPIGPSARQLNGNFDNGNGSHNQLAHWQESGIITGLPEDHATIPKSPVWNDPATGSLDERARTWLDINCAHCHNPHGPANTSGFFLDIHQTDPTAIGINKAPVAAGRASGDNHFDIVPGKPGESILLDRMISTDPGIMMPEVGRKLVDEEGVTLIKQWIQEME